MGANSIMEIIKQLERDLNEQQLAAVMHTGSPLLVLAGAGSGKTRVLTYRAYWLINKNKHNKDKVTLLTFTNKAAGEMKQRIVDLLNGNNLETLGFAGTFHSLCVRLLRKYAFEVGLAHNFVIFDSSDQESTMKMALSNLRVDPKRSPPRLLLSRIGKFKNDLVGVTQAENLAKSQIDQQMVSAWREYQRLMTEFSAVDFDDLLVKTVELLRTGAHRETIQQGVGYVLVDEYQDTNKAQFELTKLLVDQNSKLTAVGDAAQAIYSFRGADFRNINLLEREFPDLKTVRLEKNYRSTQNILDAAYGVINKNVGHPILRLTTDKGGGSKIGLCEAEDERDEARRVGELISKEVDRGKEVAVLYRTNAQSRSLEEELIYRGIKYRLVGGVRFYDRAEVKDLLAYLRLCVNEKDKVSRQRLEKVGKKRLVVFEEKIVNRVDELSRGGVANLLNQIIEVTKYLERFDENDAEDRARIENINELLAVASEYNAVEEFLETVALIAQNDVEDQEKNGKKVTLMTVHSAKGLEFDEVVVTGLEEGLFPHSRSMTDLAEMEEERRLMYVAMTRAKDRLTLCFAKRRLVYGGRQNNLPSRFLAEIPENLFERGNFGTIVDRAADGTKEVAGRRIVQDWEIDELTGKDFADIDNW